MMRQGSLWTAVVFLVAGAAMPALGAERIGRPVRIVTLSFAMGSESVDSVSRLVDREAAAGVDLVVLPETWTGKQPQPIDGPATKAMAALAKKHQTYILSPIYRQAGANAFNSAILLDRQGEIAYVYDKICPVPNEYESHYRGRSYNAISNLQCGTKAAVVPTDFGKLGLAICYDIAFPEIWQQLDDQGAEIVAWPSAYPGGLSLQAHAINHHYYIVAATHNRRPSFNCPVIDLTGKFVEAPGIPTGKPDGPTIARFTLDLDRAFYSHDYDYLNVARRLVAEHPGEIEIETYMPHEAWFILRALKPGVSARKLGEQYGLRELRASTADDRAEQDRRRGQPLADALRAK
jgi:predicted amidohydrolase